MRHLGIDEFVRRLYRSEGKFVLFLGAGCSVSSGIPASDNLVLDWLVRLRELREPATTEQSIELWAQGQFSHFDPEHPGVVYGEVIESLFLIPDERQRETEQLCAGRMPGFGYAVLANLMAANDRFNVAITTNFDDLLTDAHYLYAGSRPLVIPHDSLSNFIRPTAARPLIVKVHGDHQLAPLHTNAETKELSEGFHEALRMLLHDRGLVFIGYGGHDAGIRRFLETLPAGALRHGVYWLSRREPANELVPWIEQRNGIYVNYEDFDRLMLIVRDEFSLPHPSEVRVIRSFQNYREYYESFSGEVIESPGQSSSLQRAVVSADSAAEGWWAVALAAQRAQQKNPEQAQQIYKEGVNAFPEVPMIRLYYSRFLRNTLKDKAAALEVYEEALRKFPNQEDVLAEAGFFIWNQMREVERGISILREAVEVSGRSPFSLVSLATALAEETSFREEAKELFDEALGQAPDNGHVNMAHAIFLWDTEGPSDQVTQELTRAMQLHPDEVNLMVSYGGYLLSQGASEVGKQFLEDALSRTGRRLFRQGNDDARLEALFYAFVNGNPELRDGYLREIKALVEDGEHTVAWSYRHNVARAIGEGHADAEWLNLLAAVVSGRGDSGVLGAWPLWNDL